MRQGGADGDALLLAARQLARERVSAVGEADTLEQTIRDAVALGPADAAERQPQAHELPRPQLGRERACVVLVGVPERAGAVLAQSAAAQGPQVVAEHADRSRRRPVEPGEDAQQRALAGAARAEDDEQLAFGDVERQALERDRGALR